MHEVEDGDGTKFFAFLLDEHEPRKKADLDLERAPATLAAIHVHHYGVWQLACSARASDQAISTKLLIHCSILNISRPRIVPKYRGSSRELGSVLLDDYYSVEESRGWKHMLMGMEPRRELSG